MKCITLTLNPAFDKHCFIKKMVLGYEHLTEDVFYNAGGKGINISRALAVNGLNSNAVVVLGNENKASFTRALNDDNLHYTALTVDGRIRENLTIHTESGVETRISFKGFKANGSLLNAVYKLIEAELKEDTILTFTGSVPVGISTDEINLFLKKATDKGCKLVIDSNAFKSLEEIVALKPWLIKPNSQEISEYLNRNITEHSEILAAAKSLHLKGVKNVMISLGHKGALLVNKAGAFVCTPPEIQAESTIGAGDSSIAGFISAVMQGASAEDTLKYSVAFGTASCMRKGTLPPLPEDIKAVLSQLTAVRCEG